MQRQAAAKSPRAAEGTILQRKCQCDDHTAAEDTCDNCSSQRGPLQRHAPSRQEPGAIPDIVDETIRSPGRPLSEATRSFFEPRFRRDFSSVRIHADARAAASAHAVNADAYTVSPHIVFGATGFDENTPNGRALLAHELTHVVQQQSSCLSGGAGRAIDPDPGLEGQAQQAAHDVDIHPPPQHAAPGLQQPSLQRQPRGTKVKAPPHITHVNVDQRAQRVSAAFSDGTSVGDQCSTGKGHCCFDAASGMAEGGACSGSHSTEVGNNCTPIGSWVVTKKFAAHPALPLLWTQFHDAKSVALHEYAPVDGTPLSHGCVRLNKGTAQTIFDGARERVTKVVVTGTAQPRCDHPNLQREWEGDFRDAGTKPPDGEKINVLTGKPFTEAEREELNRERRHIEETRKELRSALDVTDPQLDTQIGQINAGAKIASRIPRCVPSLTTEEQRGSAARTAGASTESATAAAAKFTKALGRASSAAAAEKVVRSAGMELWQTATSAARGGRADDRALYWARLMLSTAIRQWKPVFDIKTDPDRRLRAKLLDLLEQTSRGLTTAAFPIDPDMKRVLASGFDPFGFAGGDIKQGNLSGAAALALDGETLTAGKVSAHVESIVYPVRYTDFDAGTIEGLLRQQLTGPRPPHFVISISQGQSDFELEEFAGRRRSAGAADNLGRVGGGSPTKPIEPPGVASGPEFLPTNVPAGALTAMRRAVGRKSALQGETQVQDLPAGAKSPRTLPTGPGGSAGKAVEGSGGGFLSNEIFYRNSLLRNQTGSTVPMVHLHTPTVAGDVADSQRNALIETIRKILRAALPFL